ncbi:hypothetical protein Asp14428_15010 [Actinoplanes sp. NBRC 14428]|nr:hypothetical protein Asp14428_15010 [Actinoplanes sp. NBRC 14428]
MNGTFTGADAYGDFARTWETRIGRPFPLAPLSPATIAAFRARSHGFRIRDVMVNGFTTEAALRTTGTTVGSDDHVRLWIVRRGAWHLGDRRGTEHPAPAGRFMAQAGRLSHFTAAPHTTAQVVVLPAAAVPHPRDRMSSGPATAAELRLLTAHADMIRRTLDNLGPAGLDAARDTLIELARAAIQGTVDETEPRLAPALAHAARALADRRLTDPTLSPPPWPATCTSHSAPSNGPSPPTASR